MGGARSLGAEVRDLRYSDDSMIQRFGIQLTSLSFIRKQKEHKCRRRLGNSPDQTGFESKPLFVSIHHCFLLFRLIPCVWVLIASLEIVRVHTNLDDWIDSWRVVLLLLWMRFSFLFLLHCLFLSPSFEFCCYVEGCRYLIIWFLGSEAQFLKILLQFRNWEEDEDEGFEAGRWRTWSPMKNEAWEVCTFLWKMIHPPSITIHVFIYTTLDSKAKC